MIDLHMHSRYSEDGEFTPTELVEQCCRQGITTMSITDHNCARANAEARTQAKTKGIRYISGIEIDCVYKELNFHVLGYGIDENSTDFARIEENIEQQSFLASLERLEKTQALGFHITQPMPLFDFDRAEKIGVVQSVDTGIVVVHVTETAQLSMLQVNHMVVIRVSMPGQTLIGMVSKIMRNMGMRLTWPRVKILLRLTL